MPYYEHTLLLEAKDDEEMDALHEKIVEALGCVDGDHECPHFRLGSWKLMPDDWTSMDADLDKETE